MLHRLYFSPGFFGFGRIASYDYFAHLERALSERLRKAGDEVQTHVVHVAPTASIRRRAAKLAELVAKTCGPAEGGGPIHLIGHSTGGLDARLVASPSASLAVPPEALLWLPRVASVTSINSPHFGTPLAAFFTTVSGERVLRATSALTFVALSLGSPPLDVVRSLLGAFGRLDRAVGLDMNTVDRVTETFLHMVDGARSKEIREYFDGIRNDQGAMVQLMPEAMDLFAAGIEDCARILYQSVVTMAPSPGPRMYLRSLAGPWSAMSGTIFGILHGISSRYDPRYPCSAPQGSEQVDAMLKKAFGFVPSVRDNDGVVPIRSQIWGNVIWAGYADHLDVLGHFRDTASARTRRGEKEAPAHVDWLFSGSNFARAEFASMADAIAEGLLSSARSVRSAA